MHLRVRMDGSGHTEQHGISQISNLVRVDFNRLDACIFQHDYVYFRCTCRSEEECSFTKISVQEIYEFNCRKANETGN